MITKNQITVFMKDFMDVTAALRGCRKLSSVGHRKVAWCPKGLFTACKFVHIKGIVFSAREVVSFVYNCKPFVMRIYKQSVSVHIGFPSCLCSQFLLVEVQEVCLISVFVKQTLIVLHKVGKQ